MNIVLIFITIMSMCAVVAVAMIRLQPKDVGFIEFNLANPEKEFLSLHLTGDIDVDHPPDFVVLKVKVLRRSENV